MAFKRTIRGKESTYFYVDFWVGSKGHPDAIHVNKSTKKSCPVEAQKEEDRLRAEAEELYFQRRGNINNTSDTVLSEAIELCWKKRWRHNRAGDRTLARVYKIKDMVGDVPISDLFGSQGAILVDDLREQLIDDTSKSNATVDLYMADLRTLINTTKDKFHLYDAIVPTFEMFNNKEYRTRTLSHEEEVELFKLMDAGSPHYSLLFKVLLDTGMRLSEALNISYKRNIFLKDKYIMITKRTMTGVHLKGNKSGGFRTIPMTVRVFNILRDLQSEFPDRPFPFRQTYCSNVFQKYRNMMGLEDDREFVPHMLRHTCTTRMLAAGVPKVYVQKILGHSNQVMTDLYEHLAVDDMREAAEVLDKLHDKIYNPESISPED